MSVLTDDDYAEIRNLSIDELKEAIDEVSNDLFNFIEENDIRPTGDLDILIKDARAWLNAYKRELALKTQVKLASVMVPPMPMKPAAGGSMPLSYLKVGYAEPSASAGSNVLVSEPGLARPVLNPTGGKRSNRRSKRSTRRSKRSKRTRKHGGSCGCMKKGGFYPTVMGSFLRNASRIVPAVAYSGYKLLKGKTRKSRK
jgi:hypothetical protein